MDYWLELEHREEAHSLEAGVWSLGWLQEEVTLHLLKNVKLIFQFAQKQFGMDFKKKMNSHF